MESRSLGLFVLPSLPRAAPLSPPNLAHVIASSPTIPPQYCSANDDQDDCHLSGSAVRGGLEKIIFEGGVDLVFGAHEHAYERNYPVYQSSWSGETGPSAYVNANRPIHILSGAAGCPENQDPWQPARKANEFSAVRINDYGYGILRVVNETTIAWSYKDNVKGAVLDEVTIVKTKQNFPPA